MCSFECQEMGTGLISQSLSKPTPPAGFQSFQSMTLVGSSIMQGTKPYRLGWTREAESSSIPNPRPLLCNHSCQLSGIDRSSLVVGRPSFPHRTRGFTLPAHACSSLANRLLPRSQLRNDFLMVAPLSCQTWYDPLTFALSCANESSSSARGPRGSCFASVLSFG